MKSHYKIEVLLCFFKGEGMKKLFILANLSFLLLICGCGESKEDKAVREFKDAATKIEKIMKK